MCHRCWTTPCICNPTVPQWETPAHVALADLSVVLRRMEADVVIAAELITREAADR